MSALGWIVLVTTLGGVLSVTAASSFLILPAAARARAMPHMVSFATGALLGAALLALVPQAMESAGPQRIHGVGVALAAGIGLFFILEKLVLWRHCHVEECEQHGAAHEHDHEHDHEHGHDANAHHDRGRTQASGVLILAGEGLHNALDGVLIAAAFLTDTRLGLVTAIAITVHEIPQEVGTFAVLLHAGMSRGRALLLNLAVSLTAVIGGVLAFFALREALQVLPYAIAVAAASLIYIAVADLIPGLHRRMDPGGSVAQVLLIAAGVAVIALAEQHAH